jgi:hypothetical protein
MMRKALLAIALVAIVLFMLTGWIEALAWFSISLGVALYIDYLRRPRC